MYKESERDRERKKRNCTCTCRIPPQAISHQTSNIHTGLIRKKKKKKVCKRKGKESLLLWPSSRSFFSPKVRAPPKKKNHQVHYTHILLSSVVKMYAMLREIIQNAQEGLNTKHRIIYLALQSIHSLNAQIRLDQSSSITMYNLFELNNLYLWMYLLKYEYSQCNNNIQH